MKQRFCAHSNSHFEQGRGKTLICLRTKRSTPSGAGGTATVSTTHPCTSITRCWQTGGLPHIMRIAFVLWVAPNVPVSFLALSANPV